MVHKHKYINTKWQHASRKRGGTDSHLSADDRQISLSLSLSTTLHTMLGNGVICTDQPIALRPHSSSSQHASGASLPPRVSSCVAGTHDALAFDVGYKSDGCKLYSIFEKVLSACTLCDDT